MLVTSLGTKRASLSSLLKALLFIILFSVLFIAFVPVKAQVVANTDKVLKDTTIAKKSYKLYLGVRGGKYVIRVSKSGNAYKQYIKK